MKHRIRPLIGTWTSVCLASVLALAGSSVRAQTTPTQPQPQTPPTQPSTTSTTTTTPSTTSTDTSTQTLRDTSMTDSSRSMGWRARSNDGSDAYSLLPYTTRGYIGLNLGRAEFDLPCGIALYDCDRTANRSIKIYTGGMFNDWLGIELGYMRTGKAERAGGDTKAEALNASLVGRVPMGNFNVFAKGGAAYGRTEITTGPFSEQASGRSRGRGWTYGAGVGLDFNRNSGIVLEWNRYRLWFQGDGRRNVDTTQIGYVHRF